LPVVFFNTAPIFVHKSKVKLSSGIFSLRCLAVPFNSLCMISRLCERSEAIQLNRCIMLYSKLVKVFVREYNSLSLPQRTGIRRFGAKLALSLLKQS
jgi:hypothetical protein